MRKLLKKYGFVPKELVTDDRDLMRQLPVILELQNDMSVVNGTTTKPRIRINRPDDENTRCRVQLSGVAQRFLSTHAATYYTFNVQRHLISARTHRAFRASAMNMWREAVAVVQDSGRKILVFFFQRCDASFSYGRTGTQPSVGSHSNRPSTSAELSAKGNTG